MTDYRTACEQRDHYAYQAMGLLRSMLEANTVPQCIVPMASEIVKGYDAAHLEVCQLREAA